MNECEYSSNGFARQLALITRVLSIKSNTFTNKTIQRQSRDCAFWSSWRRYCSARPITRENVNHIWRGNLSFAGPFSPFHPFGPLGLGCSLFTTRFSSTVPRYFIRGLPRRRCPSLSTREWGVGSRVGSGVRVFSPGSSAVNPRHCSRGSKSPSTYALRRPLRSNDKYTKSRALAPVHIRAAEMCSSGSVYKPSFTKRAHTRREYAVALWCYTGKHILD